MAISATGRGYRGAPGIYNDEQVVGWQRITDAVHAKGGRMFAQLWHAGRTTHIATTGEEPVTASVDPAYWADPEMLVVTPDGKFELDATINANGEVTISSDAPAELAEKTRLIVRTAARHAAAEKSPLPRRIVRWRGEK